MKRKILSGYLVFEILPPFFFGLLAFTFVLLIARILKLVELVVTRGVPLLQGHRGGPKADLDALRELLLRVSRLAVDVAEIVELDLNPVIALQPGLGCRIVDARIKVASKR